MELTISNLEASWSPGPQLSPAKKGGRLFLEFLLSPHQFLLRTFRVLKVISGNLFLINGCLDLQMPT